MFFLARRYTLQDMREYGRKKGWCPYYLARHMLAFANVIVYNYQYMLDPKARSRMHAAVARIAAAHVVAMRGIQPPLRAGADASVQLAPLQEPCKRQCVDRCLTCWQGLLPAIASRWCSWQPLKKPRRRACAGELDQHMPGICRGYDKRVPAVRQVSNMVSRELEKECVVVFDEAHNIDNVCIEVPFSPSFSDSPSARHTCHLHKRASALPHAPWQAF